MADAPSYPDLFDVGRTEAIRLPTRFDPAIIDTDGSDVNVVVAVSASMADEVAGFLSQAFAETFLSTASQIGGEPLDRFAWDRYQLIRQGAQAAVVPVSFTRGSPGASGLTIPAETEVSTDDGQTFSTVTDLVFAGSQAGPLTVTANATVSGDTGNVSVGAINAVVSDLDESNVSVTNSEPAAGGQPEETDRAFTSRIRDFFVNARRGTRQAIFNGAVTTPGVTDATVVEILDSNGIPGFRVRVVVSDQNGQANSALVADVAARLEDFRALGVPVQVLGGAPEFATITVNGISFLATANTNQLVSEMRSRIVSTVNSLSPGETLERSAIISAMKFSTLVRVPDDALISPAGDLEPSTIGKVIRTKSSLVSINGEVE